ncbi:MAG: hypothetical protein ACC645_11260 [Pirellulales bacterium]
MPVGLVAAIDHRIFIRSLCLSGRSCRTVGHRDAREELRGEVGRDDLIGGGLEACDKTQLSRRAADFVPRDPDAVGIAQR